ncbi:methyltransferase domain-containing protein [Candidatus Thioglobus sp.]|nr:methyltransferase domain-containing protein [Candidatus Thioglobus sp.]
MKNKHPAGDKIKTEDSNWRFSGDVVNNFDEHVKKSVPLYLEGHQITCDLSKFFVKDDSVVYEIGCSTGVLSMKLSESNATKIGARFIGFDIEKDMVDYANQSLGKTDIDNVSFEHADIISTELEKSDLIVCYYTIQFIPPSVRQKVIEKLYQSLNWGGALIMFEKVRAPDARFQDIINTIYLDYKLEQGYSEENIISKMMSLKGVLEPFSTQGNIDILKRAGFVDIMSVQKYLSFEGFLAVK